MGCIYTQYFTSFFFSSSYASNIVWIKALHVSDLHRRLQGLWVLLGRFFPVLAIFEDKKSASNRIWLMYFYF